MNRQFNDIGFDNISDVVDFIMKYTVPGWTVCLDGELGTGKTFLSSLLASRFGISNKLTSPTFTILNQYYNKEKDFYINHFDVYRLSSADELEDLGYYDFIMNDRYINFIEWSEKIKDELPENNIVSVNIEFAPNFELRNYNIKINYGESIE